MSSSSDYILIAIETPPTPDLEASELALALAAFDLPVKVIFRGAGVFWLLTQEARKAGGKSASKVLSAFSLYDINEVLVTTTDLDKYKFNINDLYEGCKVIPSVELIPLIKNSNHFLTF